MGGEEGGEKGRGWEGRGRERRGREDELSAASHNTHRFTRSMYHHNYTVPTMDFAPGSGGLAHTLRTLSTVYLVAVETHQTKVGRPCSKDCTAEVF